MTFLSYLELSLYFVFGQETKLSDLNGTLQPIMMKAMSQGSEGFPSQESVPPNESSAGPTIDEVD